jgi:hypothetical protein
MTDVADFIGMEENGEDLVDFEEDKPDEPPAQPPQVCACRNPIQGLRIDAAVPGSQGRRCWFVAPTVGLEAHDD